MKLMKSRAFLAGCCVIVTSSLSTKATVVFPIANNPNVLQTCGGLAYDGTNYLAALVVGNVGAVSEVGAQLVSPAGSVSGSLINVGSGLVYPPPWPGVAFGGGTFLEVWSDGNLKSGVDMFGQRISAAGAKVASRFPLLASVGSHGFQTVCALCSGGGHFLVVWKDGASSELYGQIVTAGGGLSGSEFLISGQPQKHNWAAVASDGTNFLVVWQNNPNGVNETYGELISSSGSPGSPFQISQTTSLDSYYPLTAAFDGSNYLVVWDSDTLDDANGNGLDWTFYGRLVSPGGALSASEVVLAGDPGSTNYDVQSFPNLAFDGQNYLLVWTHFTAGGETNANYLSGQFFDRSLNPVGTNFAALPAMGTNRPVLAANGLVYDGTRFVLAGAYGRMTPNAEGDFNGIAYWQTWGVFIPTNQAPPQIVTEPASVTNLTGATATLSVTVEGSALDYQWLKNGAKLSSSARIAGVNSASLTISNLALSDSGSYSLIASNLFGTATSSNEVLTVVPPITITIASSLAKVAILTGGGSYLVASPVTVTATVTNNCYYFTNWTVGGKVVSTNSTYKFAANQSETLVANFLPILCAVQTASNPANGGTTSGGGIEDCGSIVTVVAGAKTGFRFTNWTVGTTVASTNAIYKFTVQGNVQLTANFSDVSVPTLNIVSPTAQEKVGASLLVISGTASNVLGVGSVVLTLNGAPVAVTTTNNWTNWTASVILSPGTNVISAYAESQVNHPSKTSTVTVQETGTTGNAPVALAGLIADVESSADGHLEISFGAATLERFMLQSGQGSGVGNYTYTQTGSNTATLAGSDFAPPDQAGNGTWVEYLTFTSPTTGNTSTADATKTGTFTLSPGLDLDISSPSGWTSTAVDIRTNTITTTFGDGTFTSISSGGTTMGGYTSMQYTPMAAMIVRTNADPRTGGVETNYTLTLHTANGTGYFFVTDYDGAGGGPYYDSGTFTKTYHSNGLHYLAPETLNGMSAQVTENATPIQPGASFTATFGQATLGQTATTTNQDNTHVSNYIYTRTGTNTAVMIINNYLPPQNGGGGSAIFLTFHSSASATWSSSGGDQQSTGTITLSVLPQAGYFAPTALPQDVTINFNAASNGGSALFNYGNFTTPKHYGTYTYAQFSPTVGMITFAYTDPAAAGRVDYFQMTFNSATGGSVLGDGYDTVSNGEITIGTFSLK
jgi:hypothetical protein